MTGNYRSPPRARRAAIEIVLATELLFIVLTLIHVDVLGYTLRILGTLILINATLIGFLTLAFAIIAAYPSKQAAQSLHVDMDLFFNIMRIGRLATRWLFAGLILGCFISALNLVIIVDLSLATGILVGVWWMVESCALYLSYRSVLGVSSLLLDVESET